MTLSGPTELVMAGRAGLCIFHLFGESDFSVNNDRLFSIFSILGILVNRVGYREMYGKEFQQLVASYRTIDPRSPLSNLLADYLDHVDKLEEAKKELDDSGFFGKGKKEKAFKEQEALTEEKEKELAKKLLDVFNVLYNELSDQIKVIAIVAPQKVSAIRSLHPPTSRADTKTILSYCNEVFALYEDLLTQLRSETYEVLEQNKQLLDQYKAYVEIPLDEVASTSQTTKEALDLMNLPDLMKEKERLTNEGKRLDKRREDVERELRLRVTKDLTSLEKDTQTAISLGINVPKQQQATIDKLRQQTDPTASLELLFSAEQDIAKVKSSFLSYLRTEITRVRSEVETQVGRLATVSKETKTFPEPPDINLSVQTSLELIHQVETIRGYEKRVQLAMKRLVDVNEFYTAIRAVEAKKIPIPRSLKDDAVETAKQLHASDQLEECTNLLISYFNISSQLTEIIRQKLFETVNNKDLKSIQSVIPQPPEIDIETINPKILMRQFEQVDAWKAKISNYLQGMTSEITQLLDQLNRAERFVEVRAEFKADLSAIMNKVMGEKDISVLISLRKTLIKIQNHIYSTFFGLMREALQGDLINKLTSFHNVPEMVSSDLNSDDLKGVVDKLEEISEWKRSVLTQLKQGILVELKMLADQLVRAERTAGVKPEFKQDVTDLQQRVNASKDASQMTLRSDQLDENLVNMADYREELDEISQDIEDYYSELVNKYLQGEMVTRLSMLPGVPPLVNSELKPDKTRIHSLISKLEEVQEWKKKVQVFIKESNVKILDETRIMAETSQIFDVDLSKDFLSRVVSTRDSMKKKVDLEELYNLQLTQEKLREELREGLRRRIRSLVDLMDQLGMDIISEIGVSLDGDVPVLKESIEKIFKWMEAKKSDLQAEIDNTRSNLRLFQSKVESGQIVYKVPTDLMTEISDKGRPQSPKNDVAEMATELRGLTELAIKATEFIGDFLRKDIKKFRDQIATSRKLRATVKIPDPLVPEFNPGYVSEALESVAVLDDWKDRVTNLIVEGLKNLKFPQLRVDTEFDLSEARQITIEDLQRIPKEQAIQRYNDFLNDMEKMRLRIINTNQELKQKIASITERSETLFGQRIEDYSDSRAGSDSVEYTYAEVLQEWWNLTSHLQWQKEVLLTFIQNDIGYKLSILQELAPPHSEYFEETVTFLFEKSQSAKDKEIEEIIADYRLIQEKTIEYIEDDYRKFLQGGILPSIRVALPRIREIVSLPPRIAEIEQNIDRTITSQRDFFAIVGSANQLMGYYNEIVAELKVIAKEQSLLILKEVGRLKEVGMNVDQFVPPEIHVFSEMDEFGLAFEGEERRPATIKDTTDCFVAVDNLRGHPEVCGTIRTKATKYRDEMEKAIETISNEYGFDVQKHMSVLGLYLGGEFEKDIAQNNLYTLTDLYVNLVHVREDLIGLMKDLELETQNRFEASLEKKYEYYFVIKEIFESNKRNMEAVFPLATFLTLREEFFATNDLAEMTNALPDIRKGRGDWDETIGILSRYHKALKMFIHDFTDLSDEENRRQYEDMKKKIGQTYRSASGKQIKTYFQAATKRYIEMSTGRKLLTEDNEPEESGTED